MQKCAMVKRPYAPGLHGKKGSRLSEYGLQLAQKQKIKKTYGVLEKQFKKYFSKAVKQGGDTRQNLLTRLETRLDNVIFRAGLASSRAAARQLVGHKHILISGKTVNIPSYWVKVGQTITLKDNIKKSKLFENLTTNLKNYQSPGWLALDKEKMEVKIISQPTVDDLGNLSKIGLIVEFYSR